MMIFDHVIYFFPVPGVKLWVFWYVLTPKWHIVETRKIHSIDSSKKKRYLRMKPLMASVTENLKKLLCGKIFSKSICEWSRAILVQWNTPFFLKSRDESNELKNLSEYTLQRKNKSKKLRFFGSSSDLEIFRLPAFHVKNWWFTDARCYIHVTSRCLKNILR